MSKRFLSPLQWFVVSLKAFLTLLMLAYLPAQAAVQSTWLGATSAWDAATNWSNVPPGSHVPGTTTPAPYDTAIFNNTGGQTTTVNIASTDQNYILDTLNLTNSSGFTLNDGGSLTLAGAGITGSGVLSLDVGGGGTTGTLIFQNSASAGNGNVTLNAVASNNSVITFQNTSTAGSVNAINLSGGTLNFQDNSTGGNAQQINANNSSTINFYNSSTATGTGNVSYNVASGSTLNFYDNSTAGNTTSATNADITTVLASGAPGVTINFENSSSPANATIAMGDAVNPVNFMNTSPSTTYSGTITGGAIGGAAVTVDLGSSSDVLTFLSANPFIAPTIINSGVLVLGTATDSTASVGGDVTINSGGTLAGFGSVGGSVMNNNGGVVNPGSGTTVGTLSIGGTYTQQSGGTYAVQVTQGI